MAGRILVLCQHRGRAMGELSAEGVDLRGLLIADRVQLLPPESSKLAGVVVMPGGEGLKGEADVRFPGLEVVALASLIPAEEAEEGAGP